MSKEELLKKIRDPKFYLENFCKIKTKPKEDGTRGLVPFKLKPAQLDIFNAIRNHNRVIILKSRQIGFSSAIAGYFYHDTIMNPGTTTALIGYNSDLVSELLDKVKTFWKTTPPELRPEIQYNTKYEISFPKMDSKILILPSTENVGSGYTINNCLSGDTEILIKNGETKKIKDIKDGDCVLNGNGGPAKVKKVWKIKNNKRMLKLGIVGVPDLKLTDDHKILTREFKTGKPIWKEAKKVVPGDYIGFPYFHCRSRHKKIFLDNIIPEKGENGVIKDKFEIIITKELGELIGWYLAEGSIGNKYGRLHFSVHRDEVDYIIDLINKNIKYFVGKLGVNYKKDSKTAVISIRGKNFCDFLEEHFGKYSYGKTISESVWYWGWEFGYNLLKGLFLGDGCLTNDREVRLVSVSSKLINQTKRLLVSLRIGLPMIFIKEDVYRYDKKTRCRYDLTLSGKANYKIRRKLKWKLPVYNNGRAEYRTKCCPWVNQGGGYWKRGRFHYWAKIKKVEEIESEEFVYDLSMEKSPYSYTTISGVVHNCLLTELPKIEKAEEKMASLLPAVPIHGKFVIESSPKGQGNLYHRMWMAEDSVWEKKQYGWWWEYSQADIKQIEKEATSPQMFAQEYGCKFLASGRLVFDQDMIEEQRKNELKVGDINKAILPNQKDFKVIKKGDWIVYQEPEPESIYCCGVDVSEGVEGGSYSVAIIWDRRTGEEVAMYRGHIAPDRFGEVLDVWGRRYNNALMVPEINNHGLTTVTILRQKAYPTLYFRQAKFEAIGTGITDRLGWKTTKVTRPLLIDEFAQACREGVLIIHSKILLDEMSVFIYDDNNNMVAQYGFWCDCIFAAGIGVQGFKVMATSQPTQLNYKQYLPKTYSY